MNAQAVEQINSFAGFTSYTQTWVYKVVLQCTERIIGLFTGNQFGKTDLAAMIYVLRILSIHPNPEKNVLYFECECGKKIGAVAFYINKETTCECGGEFKKHKRSVRVFRFCSETLPGQAANVSENGISAEVKNTQYPALKRRLPAFLIKKDITARSPSVIVKDIWGGDDIIVDFVSYNQSIGSTAGVQRLSIWYDEQPPYEFREEQRPRLLKENGDEIFTLTPADHLTWVYDEIFEKAQVYYRTKTICDVLATQEHRPKRIEKTDNPYSIAVIMAATDDNPTLDIDVIDQIFESIDDPDILAIRRYGIFKQVKGRIFKDFDYPTHFIDSEKYFPEGIPSDWVHARGIDYHPQTPWAFGMISICPNNEAYIWGEENMSPEKYTTREMAHEYILKGKTYKFRLNKIDPLCTTIKKDKITILDDLNREFHNFHVEGVGTGGYWTTWETHGEKGRDAIRERLKNSLKVGRPGNNKVIENGKIVFLPTIWILNTCPISAKSMRQWRWELYTDSKSRLTKGDKNKPEQRWSHHNMVWEAIFKEPAFRPKPVHARREERPQQRYFQGSA